MKNSLIRLNSKCFPNKSIIIFFTGFFLALTIIFKIDANYTEDLFEQLSDHIKYDSYKNHETPQQTALRTMKIIYKLQFENKKELFAYDPQTFKGKYMRSSDLDLLDVSGSCGSASLVLTRTFMTMGYQCRIGQMYLNGHYGGHMVVEVLINNHWAVMDPLFNQFFIKSDGTLASFNEVQNNFNYYSKQLQPDYPKSYKFEEVRYTNWDKIPLLSPLLKKGLDIIYGKKVANEICLRKYFIKFYAIWHYVFLSLFVFFSFLLLKQCRLKTTRI